MCDLVCQGVRWWEHEHELYSRTAKILNIFHMFLKPVLHAWINTNSDLYYMVHCYSLPVLCLTEI